MPVADEDGISPIVEAVGDFLLRGAFCRHHRGAERWRRRGMQPDDELRHLACLELEILIHGAAFGEVAARRSMFDLYRSVDGLHSADPTGKL